MEQVLHEKRYLSHRMQAIFPTKFVGTAITVQLVKQENNDPHALDGMLAAIDMGPLFVHCSAMQASDGASKVERRPTSKANPIRRA